MNPLFQNSALKGLNSLQNVTTLLSSLKGQNPEAIVQGLLQTNPNFKSFYEENKGKSAEEIANKYGIDMNLIRQFL